MADAKLKATISLADKMSGPLRNVNKNLRNTQRPLKTMRSQLKQLDRNSGLKNLRKGIGGLARQIRNVGLATVAGAGLAVVAINKMADHGDKTAKNAKLYGISGKALQEWSFVAERAGVSQSILDSSMLAFTKRMGEAKAGTGALVTLLKKTSPAFLEQLKAAKSNEAAFALLVEGLRAMEDPQQKAALAAAAFSRSGVAMANVANQTAAEVQAMKNELAAYNGVLSDKALANAEKYKDRQAELGRIMGGMGAVIGTELMPQLTKMMVGFRGWYIANKKIVDGNLISFAKKLSKGIREVGLWARDIAPKIGSFIEKIGGLKGVLIAVAAVMAGPLLASIALITSSLVSLGIFAAPALAGLATTLYTTTIPSIIAMNTAMLASPITWIVAGIAAVAGAAYLIYENWAPISNWFSDMWDGLGNKVNAFLDVIKPFLAIQKKLVGGVIDFALNPAGTIADAVGFGAARKDSKPSLLKGAAKANVGGQLDININSQGQASVAKVKSNNQDFAINTNTGFSMVGM
ncbi:hypothetical protein N9Y67_00080 [Pseudomonadota bacterium]|nr:hypothetical protein [Pseudomonadota bacterium]